MNKTPIFLEDLKKESLERLIVEYYEDTMNTSKKIQSIEIDENIYGYNPECPEESDLIQYIKVEFSDGTTGNLEWNCFDKEMY